MTWLSEKILPFVNDRTLGAAMLDTRQALLADVRGEVLEVGAGTGLNLALYPRDVHVTAIEPSAAMRKGAEARLRAPDVRARVDLVDGNAHALAFDAGRFDAVVATFVLCSVRDLDTVLGEVQRVLRPGGVLHVLEHVRADAPSTARWQARVRPVWQYALGGCDPGRDVRGGLVRAGFDTASVAGIALPLPWLVRTGLVGRARRG